MIVRDAIPRDYPAIRAVVRHAFGQSGRSQSRRAVARRWRRAGRAGGGRSISRSRATSSISRLAIERDGETIEAAALAPVSVLPAFQRSGIGKALIEAGNARCAELGLCRDHRAGASRAIIRSSASRRWRPNRWMLRSRARLHGAGAEARRARGGGACGMRAAFGV